MDKKDKYLIGIGIFLIITGFALLSEEEIAATIFLLILGGILIYIAIKNWIKEKNLNDDIMMNLAENYIQQYNNAIKELEQNLQDSIDDIIIHVSILSGIPFEKINKQKAIEKILNLVKNSSHEALNNKKVNEEKIYKIVWDIAKESNQLKENKLQNYDQNSKEKIKFIQILNETAERITKQYNITISNNSIDSASTLIAGYIDKFIFSEPTIKQDYEMSLILLLYGLKEDKNKEEIINQLGNDFFDSLNESNSLLLNAYEKCILSKELNPTSSEFTNPLNNFEYYLNIFKQNFHKIKKETTNQPISSSTPIKKEFENNLKINEFTNELLKIKNSKEESGIEKLTNIYNISTRNLNSDFNDSIFAILFPTISQPCIEDDGKNVLTTNIYTFMDFIIFLFIQYRIYLHKENNRELITVFTDIFEEQLKNTLFHFNLISEDEYEKLTNNRMLKYDDIILSKPNDLANALNFTLEQYILHDLNEKPYDDNNIIVSNILDSMNNVAFINQLFNFIMNKRVIAYLDNYIEMFYKINKSDTNNVEQ